MTAVSLLACICVLPGAQALEPMDVWADDGVIAVDEVPGDGRPLAHGLLEVILQDPSGRTLMSSEERGQFLLFRDAVGDPLLDLIAPGMTAGATRRAWISADRFPLGFGRLAPAHADLQLVLKLRPL